VKLVAQLQSLERQKLKDACLRLPETSVREEEEYVAGDPVLILMSAVLSLCRDWYAQARPYRVYFEKNVYPTLTPKTLLGFRDFISNLECDWLAVSKKLWGNREHIKAQQLAGLVDYFIIWFQTNAPGASEIEALHKWASSTTKNEFLWSTPGVRRLKGLALRAYEQLHWYLDGAIKFDRHVERFVSEVLGHAVTDEEAKEALVEIASEMGIDQTNLDARVWDFMQKRAKKNRRQDRACKRATTDAADQPSGEGCGTVRDRVSMLVATRAGGRKPEEASA
jgi:hypothetical protein